MPWSYQKYITVKGKHKTYTVYYNPVYIKGTFFYDVQAVFDGDSTWYVKGCTSKGNFRSDTDWRMDWICDYFRENLIDGWNGYTI